MYEGDNNMIKTAYGEIKRIVAARMSPGEDVMQGLERICAEHDIKNGIILSAIGSLAMARFYNPVPLMDKKAGYGYSDPIEMHGPVELISMDGMICHDDKGDVMLHMHYALSGPHGSAHGGHLIEGNKVLLTLDVVIGEIDGVDMGRRYDADLELMIFAPEQHNL